MNQQQLADAIREFLGSNLHIILDDEGDKSEIPHSKFADDLAKVLVVTTPQDIESRIKRLAKFINGLSAWNLHRGEEAIQELLQDAQRTARIDEVKLLNAIVTATEFHVPSRHKIYSYMSDRLAELQHPKDDKQDGLEAEG